MVYFCSRIQIKDVMVMDRHYTKEYGANLKLFTTDDRPAGRILRGKALYNDQESEMTFVENAPRGPRSVEVGRTAHSRFVRRPDGLYTITFRVDAGMPYLRQVLVAEVNELSRLLVEDRKGVRNGK